MNKKWYSTYIDETSMIHTIFIPVLLNEQNSQLSSFILCIVNDVIKLLLDSYILVLDSNSPGHMRYSWWSPLGWWSPGDTGSGPRRCLDTCTLRHTWCTPSVPPESSSQADRVFCINTCTQKNSISISNGSELNKNQKYGKLSSPYLHVR